MTEPQRETPCAHPADAVKWNEYNGVRQCHQCGTQITENDSGRCAIAGCDYWPLDERGPIGVNGRHAWVCTEHWEAVLMIVGQQQTEDSMTVLASRKERARD